ARFRPAVEFFAKFKARRSGRHRHIKYYVARDSTSSGGRRKCPLRVKPALPNLRSNSLKV
ncbi:MAG: hypothetical protein ACLQOO_36815, partial [Terriglobia bacterium]